MHWILPIIPISLLLLYVSLLLQLTFFCLKGRFSWTNLSEVGVSLFLSSQTPNQPRQMTLPSAPPSLLLFLIRLFSVAVRFHRQILELELVFFGKFIDVCCEMVLYKQSELN